MAEGTNAIIHFENAAPVGGQIVSSLHRAALSDDSETARRLFDYLDRMMTAAVRRREDLLKQQALGLWITELVWDKLPYEITLEWRDFMGWATERTGYQHSSIRNLIRGASTFYVPGLRLPERVTLRDDRGRPVANERGEVRSVNPDVFDVPISKLYLTAKAFREARMTEEQMGMLFNRDVSFGALAESLRDERLLASGRPVTRFFLEGSQLVICEDGETKAFGELYLFSDDPLVRKGIRHVLLAAGIAEA